MRTASGIYHAAPPATEAVRTLLGESIPADAIGVTVYLASGETEGLDVQDETGVWSGAWLGARIGAVAGALLMGGLAVLIPLSSGDGLFAGNPFTAALRGALGGAAAGVTLGGIVGIGRWNGLSALDEEVLEGSRIHVRVHSDELADTAAGVLQRTGADNVAVSDSSDR